MSVRILLIATLALSGCELKLPEVRTPDTTALAVGQSREVSLRYVRFDVTGFSKRLSKADLLDLPDETRRRLWLLDLNISGTDGAPKLMDNALRAIRSLDPTDSSLGPAERNMVRLLQMTPDTARLQGTSMEQMLEIAPRIGLAPAQVLADSMGINPEDYFLDLRYAREVILENVIRTHPNAQMRPGPKTASNPQGLYPVPFGHLAVTLEDAASDFATLSRTYGPYFKDGVFHPGFISGQVSSALLQPNFAMTVKANPNALPFKGIDGTIAAVASVNSIGNDRRDLFDFSDPDWLKVEGLPDGPLKIDELTFQIVETPEFYTAGRSPLPGPRGSGAGWQSPPWSFERVVIEGGFRQFTGREYSRDYFFGTNPEPLVKMRIEDAWLSVETAADLGSPPPPVYLFDMLLEAAQVRLHDGPDPLNPDLNRIPEGQATLRFTLHDIEIGISADTIQTAIRENIEADPTSLIDVASQLFNNGSGAPDFFYIRAEDDNPPEVRGDWLFFIAAEDIPQDDLGLPTRDYARYKKVGFYKDAALTMKISSASTLVSGDRTREKVRVDVDDPNNNTVYYEDDDGSVFEVAAVRKPTSRQVVLRVTRVR